MVEKLKPIYEYGYDVFSQNGEDGIIEFLFNKLEIKGGLVFEVGANDGVWCSNTRNLYHKNHNFKAVLVEADGPAFQTLIGNTLNMPNAEIFHRFIDSSNSSPNSIDSIIKNSKFKDEEFVLVSIDVDGEDYNIWQDMKLQPFLVIIEVPIFLENDPVKKNILQYIDLGKEKGYEFLGMSGILDKQAGNMIFLRNDLVAKFELPPQKDRILLHSGKRWI